MRGRAAPMTELTTMCAWAPIAMSACEICRYINAVLTLTCKAHAARMSYAPLAGGLTGALHKLRYVQDKPYLDCVS